MEALFAGKEQELFARLAEEARLAKQQFLANVSHELRTPLNMILGFAEMIMQAPETYGRELPPALLADLAVIWRNSQHLSELLDDVLDLSQIEAGRMALRKEYVALPEIIASAVEAVRPLYESKGLYLRTEVPKDLPEVFCDPTRIREVVLNLLSNAGRFTEAGGVCVRARQDGSEVLVSVADTGPGIASEDAPKVFQPFQQLDGSMRRRHAGSGLGLAISKSFVELHGGRMWFESQKGVGTTFFFRVPVSPPISGDEGVRRWFSPYWYYEERTRRSTVPVPPIRPRFVVVETGNSLGRLLRRYLDEAEVQSMASVDEAVAELQRVPTQALVINDAHAESILRHLSASGSLPRGTAAIACSIPGALEVADMLGVAGYLVKPISRRALLDALERLPGNPKTILLVEDDAEALQLFWRMLRSSGRGYNVLTARDGKQALDRLAEGRPDAILLDLMMPQMDGLSFLKARAEDPALRSIPTIVVSARDPTSELVAADTLAIGYGGGLTVSQVLACVEGVSRILSSVLGPDDRALRATQSA
ncbi:MAG: hybrid sensor histidine kinase/response regulator [Anaerolineae bacterium]|nr:hybrid sensor histidine kinase/response regulator [Anaerolineae bacterium]